jgi:hypothetical protein
LRDAGHYAQAGDAFRKCTADSCPALIRRDCANWLESLAAQTPTLVFVGRDAAGVDVLAGRVLLDGRVVASQLDGRPIRVDPGPHLVRVEGGHGAVWEQRIVARAGEIDRRVVATLAGPRGPQQERGRDGTGAGRTWAAIAVGGVSLASLGVGLYFGLAAESDLHSLEASPCAPKHTCPDSEVSSDRTRLYLSDAFIGAAIVGGLVTLGLLLIHPSAAATAAMRFRFDAGGSQVIGTF